jgi:hypothetical protein
MSSDLFHLWTVATKYSWPTPIGQKRVQKMYLIDGAIAPTNTDILRNIATIRDSLARPIGYDNDGVFSIQNCAMELTGYVQQPLEHLQRSLTLRKISSRLWNRLCHCCHYSAFFLQIGPVWSRFYILPDTTSNQETLWLSRLWRIVLLFCLQVLECFHNKAKC